MFGPCLVMHYLVFFLVFNHLDEEERRALCLTLTVFLLFKIL